MREFLWGAKSWVRGFLWGLKSSKHDSRRAASAPNRSARGLLCLFVASLAAASVVMGCGWDGFERSVRFNLYATDRDRQRLPPLPFKLRGDEAKSARKVEGDDYRAEEREKEEADALWSKAVGAVEHGELEGARALLEEYEARGVDVERRNSAADQLDALSALERGSPAEHVRAYLDARRAYDNWRRDTQVKPHAWPTPTQEETEQDERKEERRAAGMESWGEEVGARLSSIERDPELADNAAYLRAVGVYRAGQDGDAVAAFASVASRYPRSEKREAALFMAGRASMEASTAYLAGEDATSEKPCPECRDEAWRAAHRYFSRVVTEHPRGRFAADARGWMAFLDWRVGERAGALVEYYRMLADERDEGANSEALLSLNLVRGHADESDMERVEAALASEPKVALTYAYHEIYNDVRSYDADAPELEETSGASSDGPDSSSDGAREREEERPESEKSVERDDLARVARFATRMIERYPGTQVGGAFLVRVAEANLERNEDRAALGLARRALAQGVGGVERACALWVEGVAEYRLKDLAASRRTLARLVGEFPGGDLDVRARRLLAVASEEAGDLDAALEQYIALRYEPDVAYFVDVLLTPDRLASFVERHPDTEMRDVLLYSLGVRYLRAGRYPEARAALRRVRTIAAQASDGADEEDDYYAGYYNKEKVPRDPKYHIRRSFWDDYGEQYSADGVRETGVYADWVLADLQTANDLERLEADAARPGNNEAKAESLYQLASYIYGGSDLKFYNPALWRGTRGEVFSYFDEDHYRAPGEAEAVWRYMQEHETAARALAIYLDIARRFPETRAARDALYTAAVCQQRLSNYNEYWRRAYADGLHAGATRVTYEDVRRTYPGYRFPRGANGWEPSTRTVNGGPAWPATPKPKELTRAAWARLEIKRAETRVGSAWELFGEIYGGRVRRWTLAALRWSLAALVACLVLIVFRRTRRARRFLYRHLARRRTRAREGRRHKVYAPKSSYAAHLRHTRGGALRGSAGDAAHKLLQLLTHERGRTALALNLFAHSLLTVLLWVVLWAMKK
jgi:TolA-binding protein